MNTDAGLLATTAAAIAIVHTASGPDHYLPFVALAREREWSLAKTLALTSLCGAAHVGGSILLGMLGLLLGWAIGDMVWFEGLRGGFAGWLLLSIGLAYMIWGLRQAMRNRPHQHWHHHRDGTFHQHPHTHRDEHLHTPVETSGKHKGESTLVAWLLFWVFVLGPSEPLIPLLIVPAAEASWWSVASVILVYGLCTLGTMLTIVAIGRSGLARLTTLRVGRYSHALAGFALFGCGVAIQLGL